MVETRLKLLYTAVTRCIEQLFFVETSASHSGNAAVRWLTTTSTMKAEVGPLKGSEQKWSEDVLATRNDVQNVDAMSMTCDEWVSSGFATLSSRNRRNS